MGFFVMAMNDSSSDSQTVKMPKKPYEKPSFRFEQVFVTTALTCGKSGTEQQCVLTNTQSAS
jgi:hypothetical protein